MWPDYAQLNCRLPSQYRATVIRLSLDVVCAALPCLGKCSTGSRRMSAAMHNSSVIECSHDKFHSRPRPCKCTSPNERVTTVLPEPPADHMLVHPSHRAPHDYTA